MLEPVLDFTAYFVSPLAIRTSVAIKRVRASGLTPWIEAHSCRLTFSSRNDHRMADLRIDAPDGYTDAEHDKASLVAMDLIDVQLIMVAGGRALFSGWLDPDPESLRVPSSADFTVGESWCGYCKGKRRHKVIPYVPAPRDDLVKYAGAYVEIWTGTPARD